MESIRVEVTCSSRGLKEILINDEELDISPICDRRIEDWFIPAEGRGSWQGLLPEIHRFLMDDEANLSFEFHGPEDMKHIFDHCLQENGIVTQEIPVEKDLAVVCFQAGEKTEHRGNEVEAFRNYQQAAELGHREAQFRTAQCWIEGRGVRRDEKEALCWFKKAASQGHPGAEFYIGKFYDLGIGVEKDMTKAAEWYGKAAE